MVSALSRWPLLVVGLVLIGWAVALTDQDHSSEARAVLYGIGCLLLGAGLAVLLFRAGNGDGKRNDKHDGER